MPIFDLEWDPSTANRFLATFLKQTPFAMALALTRTAQDVQAHLRQTLDDDGFTIRTSWVQRRISIRRATKTKLESRVGSKDAFMRLHLEGGVKIAGDLPKTSGEALGVPVGARPTPQSVTRRSRFPAALLRRKGFFLGKLPSGEAAIYQRLRGGKLRLMYLLKRRVTIPKRWRFEERVEEIVRRRWGPNVIESLRRAIRTARL